MISESMIRGQAGEEPFGSALVIGMAVAQIQSVDWSAGRSLS